MFFVNWKKVNAFEYIILNFFFYDFQRECEYCIETWMYPLDKILTYI